MNNIYMKILKIKNVASYVLTEAVCSPGPPKNHMKTLLIVILFDIFFVFYH